MKNHIDAEHPMRKGIQRTFAKTQTTIGDILFVTNVLEPVVTHNVPTAIALTLADAAFISYRVIKRHNPEHAKVQDGVERSERVYEHFLPQTSRHIAETVFNSLRLNDPKDGLGLDSNQRQLFEMLFAASILKRHADDFSKLEDTWREETNIREQYVLHYTYNIVPTIERGHAEYLHLQATMFTEKNSISDTRLVERAAEDLAGKYSDLADEQQITNLFFQVTTEAENDTKTHKKRSKRRNANQQKTRTTMQQSLSKQLAKNLSEFQPIIHRLRNNRREYGL